MTNAATIEANNISLTWPFYHKGKQRGQKVNTQSQIGGEITHTDEVIQVNALNNISFQLKHGDRLALIGQNGAGKSTLLRLMAGVYTPTFGQITVNGKVTSLFTSTIGMSYDATGYENISLMCRLLGIPLTPQRIDNIVEFSELGEFIHLPLRTYSAGMLTRLGFAIATSIRSNVLLIDEVIGAGDASFYKKSFNRINDMISTVGTLVLACHDLNVLNTFCNLGLWLEKGQVRKFGPMNEVTEEYQKYIT